jgi:hypothetical protein
MAVASNRFECVADPCDLWMVWDRWRGVPVTIAAWTSSAFRRRRP